MMKTIIASLVTAGALTLAGSLPVAVEQIPARLVTRAADGCFIMVNATTANRISKQTYDSFGRPGAAPVQYAWCGWGFNTSEKRLVEGDYFDDPTYGRLVMLKGKLHRGTPQGFTFDGQTFTRSESLIASLLPKEALAAISYQNKGIASGSSVTSITTAFNVGSGSNRLLSVQVNTYDSTYGQVTGITYAGVALTQAVEQVGRPGTDNWTETWYLANPASNNNNVVTTLNGTTLAVTHSFIALNGVSQGAPDATNSGTCNTASGVACTATTTTVTDNAWVISNIQAETGTITGCTGCTVGSTDGTFMADGYSGPKTPAGQVSHQWNHSASTDQWVWTGVAYAPYSCDPSTTFCEDRYETVGYNEWTAPTGVTTAYVACWGGGGGGGDGSTSGGGAGGGGGAFASSSVSVTAGQSYTIYVGGGGTAGSAGSKGGIGATSTFATTTLIAPPGEGGNINNGAGGAGGTSTYAVGTVKYTGGTGGGGDTNGTTQDTGGGGGGAAGPQGNGNNGQKGQATTGGTGGTGNAGSGGTAGSAGNNITCSPSGDGGVGGLSRLGAGGGGGADNGCTGGTGNDYGSGGGGGEAQGGAGNEGACVVGYTSAGGVVGASASSQDIFDF